MLAAPVTRMHDCHATCSRRAAVTALASAGALALLAACASDESTAPPRPGAVTVTAAQVVIQLDLLDALRSDGSAYVLRELQMIVLRLTIDDYRTFTNLCTHSGCGIGLFESQRMKCQCHGSEFDVDGRNVAGPAPEPLARYLTTFAASRRTLSITRPS